INGHKAFSRVQRQIRRHRSAGENKGTSCHQSLIDELEASISQRNIGSRAEILRQTTDLFVAGSGYFDNEQMALFDDVMNRWSMRSIIRHA
ncbi:MAG: hypothetical protein WCF80_21840, partial [Pseudolabrys sp.]